MEKYGTVTPALEPQPGEKTSGDARHCPKCGGRIVSHGSVLKCENCGTQPFEALPKKQPK